MPVFVAVVMLGLAFFLSCLLAIYVDERRRRGRRADLAEEELTPLETISRSRMRHYRRVISLPLRRKTRSSRVSSEVAGQKTQPLVSTRQHAPEDAALEDVFSEGEKQCGT